MSCFVSSIFFSMVLSCLPFFFFNDTATTEIYTLSLHDALPISGLPVLFRVAPAHAHDSPFARPLLAAAVTLFGLRPRVIRLDAGYWGLRLIAWIHQTLGAVAVVPWNPKRQQNRSCLPPTWTAEELGKRSSIERFFGRVFSLFSCFRLQRPPLCGWAAVTTQVALTYTATIVVGLAAQQAGRPDLIRSPKRVLAHTWEGLAMS